MKADRLYGITLYLLNHKRASGRCLADTFEVSLRCIQRDMDTLSMAGVPIIAYSGVNGGYELQEGYKLPASLDSMESAGLHKEVQTAKLLFPKHEEDTLGVQLDFSVANETAIEQRRLLQSVIAARHSVTFQYTDAQGKQTKRFCEAVALIFRWYAWYLVGWDVDKQAYRMYKLVRMEQLQEAEHTNRKHPCLREILKQLDETDTQVIWTIKLHCQPEARGRVLEYFQGTIMEVYADTSFLYCMQVPKQEHFWYASLLGMGNTVRVLEPEELVERIKADCRAMLKQYEK